MGDWLEQRRREAVTRRAEVMRLLVLAAQFRAAVTAGTARCGCAPSVGRHGQVVALWSAAGDQAALTSVTVRPGFAGFPDPVASRPVPVRVTVHDSAPVTAARIVGLVIAHPPRSSRCQLAGS